MTEVHHHAHTVHLLDDFLAQLADTSMFAVTFGRVADVVVAIVAERHIDHASLAEFLHIGDVLSDGIAILNAQHDGFLARALETEDVFGAVGDIHRCAVLRHHLLYLSENLVGFGCGVDERFVVAFQLLEVCHHDAGIEPSFRHLVQIDQDTRVARGEVDVLGKEHRGVAVGIECDDALVNAFGCFERRRFACQPLEDGFHVVLASHAESLWMPLHAENGLVFGRFHRLDDAIRAGGGDFQTCRHILDRLVVEGVDVDGVGLEQLLQQRSLSEVDAV